MCADIDGEAAAATAAGIGEQAIGLRADVTVPDECAAMIERAVSASDESSWVTGTAITIDGGMSAA